MLSGMTWRAVIIQLFDICVAEAPPSDPTSFQMFVGVVESGKLMGSVFGFSPWPSAKQVVCAAAVVRQVAIVHFNIFDDFIFPP